MDAVLLIREPLTYTENSAQRSLFRRIQSVNEVATSDAVYQVTVRFQPYEAKLLQPLINEHASQGAIESIGLQKIDVVVIHLLYRWSWAFDVLRQLLSDLDPLEVNEFYHGSKLEGFEMAKNLLRKKANDQCDDRRFERTRQLVSDNKDFPDFLHSLDIAKIDLSWHPQDIPLWRGLAVLFLSNLDEISNWKGFRPVRYLLSPSEKGDDNSGHEEIHSTGGKSRDESETSTARETESVADGLLNLEDTWDVWRFCRMFRLLKKTPANTMKLFTLDSSFTEHWREINVHASVDEDNDSYHGFVRRKSFERVALSSILDFFEHNRIEDLTNRYRERLHNQGLEEPSRYLEHIPWDELTEPQSLERIHDSLDQLDLRVDNVASTCFRLWRCNQVESLSRVFFIDEEIYSYHILRNFEVPGFRLEGDVIFRCSPLTESTFCQDLDNFWARWNDCALTRHPGDGQILLLETLPGLKFRQLGGKLGFSSAHQFFSSVLRQSLRGIRYSEVQQLLGSNYDPSYIYSLEYIHPNDFRDLSKGPIGQGGYGKVFRATWTRMPAQELGIKKTKCGEVAIKVPWQQRKVSSADRKKFFEELRTVHTALSGDAGPLLKFLGFSKCFTDDAGRLYVDLLPNLTEVFVLVFEYATEGTILDYLRDHLRDGQSMKNWEILCNMLADIAAGLEQIHSRDIIHRDIHPNNVLVKRRILPHQPITEYESCLTDLGEGKKMDENDQAIKRSRLSTSIRDIGLRPYKAPEITGMKGYSKASDMYAFGQLGVDMIRLNNSKFEQEEGMVAILPAKLVEILESCKDEIPDRRYPAILVAQMFEELVSNLLGESIAWVTASKLPVRNEEDAVQLTKMWSTT